MSDVIVLTTSYQLDVLVYQPRRPFRTKNVYIRANDNILNTYIWNIYHGSSDIITSFSRLHAGLAGGAMTRGKGRGIYQQLEAGACCFSSLGHGHLSNEVDTK